jgi:phenylalanyl-tRNA synthetase alpha chain
LADLTALTQEALAAVAACGDLTALEDVRVRWLGKKGLLTEQLKALGVLPVAERPARASTKRRSRCRRRSRRAARRSSAPTSSAASRPAGSM